ncbi:cytochrome P450 [Xylaria arbuscula]|nr:cytochrome P450 [Xylaria arbuscula]
MSWATFGHIRLGAAVLGHMQVFSLIAVHTLLAFALLCVEYFHVGRLSDSITTVGYAVGSYAIGLFSSNIIYRRYFHRLSPFPGPQGKSHLFLEELSKQYGPIIRTGTEELTIIDAAIPQIIDSPKSQFTKPPDYDFILPVMAISSTRDVEHHDNRRRIWNQALSPKALAGYEDIILRYAELLANQIGDIFSWLGFDVRGEFAFSKSFRMLQDRKLHPIIRLMVDGISGGSSVGYVPWLVQLGKSLRPRPSRVKDLESMLQWYRECMNERLQVSIAFWCNMISCTYWTQTTDVRPDLSQWLINSYKEDGYRDTDLSYLHGDAVTITVASALTFAFYHLARDASQQFKGCTYLTAFINEILRLYPPVPTAGNRASPPEAPKYSIQRLESSYEKADQFIPDRWTTRPDMVKDNRGFTPFALGKYG